VSILSLIVAGILLPARRAQNWIAASILSLLIGGQLVFRLLPGLA